MKFQSLGRWVSYSVALCQILLSCTLFLSVPVYAQIADTEPPEVGLDSVSEARKGDSQVFTITATDDSNISDLTIFYRQGVSGEFLSEQMVRIGNTNLFTFTLPAESIALSTDVIQYYFDARDAAGNRTLQGFSFDPLERDLTSTVTAQAEGPNSAAPASLQGSESGSLLGSLSTTQKVVYSAIALVVVGALISAASDGGDESGGSGENPGTELTPVTITSDPLVP